MFRPWQQGDITETGFLFRSTEEGFQVSMPFGGHSRYDAILDSGDARWRVQIKSTSYRYRPNVYRVKTCRSVWAGTRRDLKSVSYSEADIDFIVIYLIPEKTWYIISSADLKGRKTLDLYSPKHKKYGKWGKHREAWDLFRQPAPCTCCQKSASADRPTTDPSTTDRSTTATTRPSPPVSPEPQPPDPEQQ